MILSFYIVFIAWTDCENTSMIKNLQYFVVSTKSICKSIIIVLVTITNLILSDNIMDEAVVMSLDTSL